VSKRRKNSGPADERLDDVLKEFRRILLLTGRAEPIDAVPPIDIDGRLDSGTLSATYTVNNLSITIDFNRLGSGMLTVADSVFAETFGPDIVTFVEGSTLRDAVNEYVARSLQWVDGVAITTLADYFTELVVHGAAFAAESFAEELFAKANMSLTKSHRKPFRDIARSAASTLLETRIPNVGRGGSNRTARDIMSDTILVAFHVASERVYPFWKDVNERAKRGDDAWHADAKKLPEYGRFKAKEKRHADALLALLQSGRKINGALPDPRRLTREHARLIVGMKQESDSQLRKHAKRGKSLSAASQGWAGPD